MKRLSVSSFFCEPSRGHISYHEPYTHKPSLFFFVLFFWASGSLSADIIPHAGTICSIAISENTTWDLSCFLLSLYLSSFHRKSMKRVPSQTKDHMSQKLDTVYTSHLSFFFLFKVSNKNLALWIIQAVSAFYSKSLLLRLHTQTCTWLFALYFFYSFLSKSTSETIFIYSSNGNNSWNYATLLIRMMNFEKININLVIKKENTVQNKHMNKSDTYQWL